MSVEIVCFPMNNGFSIVMLVYQKQIGMNVVKPIPMNLQVYEKKCSPFLVSHFGCSWVGDFGVATVYDVLIDVGEIPLCPLSICSSDTYISI